MSQQLEYSVFVEGDERKAAELARRLAYERGWAGLKVVNTIELAKPAYSRQCHFKVTLIAVEQRVGGPVTAMAHWAKHWGTGRGPALGTAVRTRSVGVDYSGGVRHAIPPGAIGTIVGHRYPNMLVSFPELPGHRILYASQDLEILP